MKKLVIIMTLVLALVLTSCSATVEKGQKLMSDRKYDDAIEVFEKVIEKDETNYDAWFGIIKSQIKDDEYGDAEDSLKDLLEVIDDNYDDSSDVDYESIFEDFQKYADDIIEEEGSLGSWYDKLKPAAVDVLEFDYQTYETGAELVLTVPEDSELYYNMTDEPVTDKDKKYQDKIVLDTEGSFYLGVAAVNKFGMMSDTNYAYITVATTPDAPTPDTESGTYKSPMIVHFGTYDENAFSIYYTTDGTDPTTNGYSYYDEDGIRLPLGSVQLRAVMYDYNSGMYSSEITADYVIEAQAAPSVDVAAGTYKAPLTLHFSGFDPDNATIYYTTDGTDPESYGMYYDPTMGVVLAVGTYQLRASIYDYNSWEYSEELVGTYTVN